MYVTNDVMQTVSEAVRALVGGNELLRSGLDDGLLNLSSVARFILPSVQARLNRDVTVSAVLMSLSRLQRERSVVRGPTGVDLFVDRIHVQSGLCTLTVPKSAEAHQETQRFFSRVQGAGGYVTYAEGTAEITLLVEETYLRHFDPSGAFAPKQLQRRIAGLGVTFRRETTERPGLLYRLLQQIAMQRINVVEVNSTMTEFTIYVHEDDVRLAFDSIYRAFVQRSG